MPGLARVDRPAAFVLIVRCEQMNVAIVNLAASLATFIGALLAARGCRGGTGRRRSVPGMGASPPPPLTIGTVAITAAGNVPLNDALQAAGGIDRITDLAAVRADFESRWVALNIARCLTSAGALACLAVAATKVPG